MCIFNVPNTNSCVAWYMAKRVFGHFVNILSKHGFAEFVWETLVPKSERERQDEKYFRLKHFLSNQQLAPALEAFSLQSNAGGIINRRDCPKCTG